MEQQPASAWAQLVPDGFQSGSVYTGPLRMLIYVVFPAPLAAASEIQLYRFVRSSAAMLAICKTRPWQPTGSTAYSWGN